MALVIVIDIVIVETKHSVILLKSITEEISENFNVDGFEIYDFCPVLPDAEQILQYVVDVFLK